MATISTDTYLDDGTARTADETWTINNNATFTIRTDTRWHANAPASMTGTVGNISASTTQGGKLFIDATQVRWMPFDTGSGNVPAIGTSITQGGVSGYLLGVWSSYTSAPTAVGAAMPASGYLKFREVTGGQYSVGALTGIGANATEADRAGWIEYVTQQSRPINMGQLGEFTTRGDWFYHETLTSGSAHQFIQFPTNGAGTTGNFIFAVQIETAPGSGVFKWWHGLANPTTSGDSMYSTSIIGTDERSRYYKSLGDGTIQLGGDGTNLIGYVPPAGCKIRIPNILIRCATSSAQSVNIFGQVGNVSSSYGGIISNNTKLIDWQFLLSTFFNTSFSGTSTVLIDNCAIYGQAVFDNIRSSGSFTNSSVNYLSGSSSQPNFRITNTAVPFTVDNVFITDPFGISGVGYGSGVSKSSNLTMANIEFNMISTWYSEHSAMNFDGMQNSTITNLQVTGANSVFTNCLDTSLTNFDYCIRLKGPITGAPSNRQEGITVSNCGNFKIDGYSIGKNGAYTNLQPYSTCVTVSGTVGPNSFRNFGSRGSFISAGSNSYKTAYMFEVQPGSNDVKIQRCYITDTRTGIINFNGASATDRLTVESVMGPYTKSIGVTAKNASFKGLAGAVATTAGGYYGTHFADFFISDTTSALVWYGVQPSAFTSGENYLYSPTESAKYLAPAAQVLLNTVGDYFYSEMSYSVKGHTSFRNVAPTITGTNTNLVTYEYQLDTGAGYGGTWKTLNTTNLLAETISETGFKMKFRGTLTSAGTAQITSIQVFTSTTVQAQTDNLYTMDTASVTLTGLAVGSEVRAYAGSDPSTAVEIGGTEAAGGSTFTFNHSVAGQDGHIVILAMGYQPIYLSYTYKSSDDSILIQPVIDRNYNNPA